MSGADVLTFASGIIMCVIGVCTFVTGMTGRAKGLGILSQKVDEALRGIEEIKQTLTEQRTWREGVVEELSEHREQLHTLFNRVNALEAWKENITNEH